MNKTLIFATACAPSSLTKPMTSALAQQAETFGCSLLPDAELSLRLYDASDLTAFDRRTLESQCRLYDPSHLKRDRESFTRWALKRILREENPEARSVIADALGIVEIEGTVEDLLALDAYDPELVTHLLSGHVHTAARMVPSCGYGEEDSESSWTEQDVQQVVTQIARLWLANDLQLEAAATHVRLFRPTQMEVLDGYFTGEPPRQGRIAATIEAELELFEEAARLYFGEDKKSLPTCRNSKHSTPNQAMISSGTGVLSLTWPPTKCSNFGREATTEETGIFRRHGLEGPARIMLAIWRAAHGDQLEEYIWMRMNQARAELRRLREEIEAVRNDPSRRKKHAYHLHGLGPLIRLWLACERAVAWTGPIQPPGHEQVGDPLDYIEEALRVLKAGGDVARPRIRKHNTQAARELFFALRCTIVRDPEHLPAELRSVALPCGKTVRAKRREDVELLRGAPLAFADIWEHQTKQITSGRNTKEVFSHPFTTPARRFVRDQAGKPTDEGQKIVEQAWGTIAWRLQQ